MKKKKPILLQISIRMLYSYIKIFYLTEGEKKLKKCKFTIQYILLLKILQISKKARQLLFAHLRRFRVIYENETLKYFF